MMKIKYRITKFSPVENQFLVLYFTDKFQNGISLNLPLPLDLEETSYLGAKDLDSYIQSFAPTDELERIEKIISIDTTYIDSLVESEVI